MADFEADRVVVELLAKVDKFDGQVVASSQNYAAAMKTIETSGARAEASVARSSDARIAAIRRESAQITAASRMMGSQLNDIGNLLVSDKSPFVVPVKQAPAVSSAMKVVSVGASALGGVLGGVAAAGALALVAALVDLIFKNKDTAKEVAALVEKMKEQAAQARLNEQANAIWEKSLDGLIEKTRKLREEQEKQLQTDKEQLQRDVADRQDELTTSRGLREKAARDLDAAKRELEAAQAAFREAAARPGRANEGLTAVAAQRVNAAEKEVSRLTAELQKATVQAGDANEALHNAEIILSRMNAQNLADPIKAIEDRFAGLRREAENSIKSIPELTKRLAELARQEKAATDAARKRAETQREVGGRLTSEQAKALVNAQFGAGSVTSGRRSAEHNKDVGGVPGSFHVSGQAIDVKKAAGISLNKLKQLISAQGVIIEEALDEGDHFHIAWRNARTQAERLAAEQKRLADAEANRTQAYQNEKAGLEDSVLDARHALIQSADEIALIELAAIDLSRSKYADQVAHNLAIGKLHEDEAKELLKLNEERAKLRKEAVQQRVDERNFRIKEAEARRALEAQTGAINIEEELLQSRQGLARTADQRHELERRLIDLQFQEEKLQLEAIIAETERLETKKNLSDAEKLELEAARVRAELAQQQLATLGERQANAQEGNDRSNAGPLGDFFNNIPQTADEINEALESIAAGGLATFTDALTDAIVNWRGFGNVALQTLRSVAAGIIKLGIQQLLLHTIGKVLGKTAVASTAAAASASAAAWAPAAALASLATLGANAGPAAAAIAGTNALALGFAAASGAAGAAGGFQSGGFTGFGPTNAPAGVVHGQEFVFDAPATKRIGVPMLEALRRGTVRPSNLPAAQPRGASGFGSDAVGELRGIVADAIAAMPPVQLFPTYDPVVALEAALNNNRGRRVLLDFMGDNRGAVESVRRG